MTTRLFFSVGEPSGDLHAANLIRSMRQIQPTLGTRGFGGSQMVSAGFEQDFDLTSMAVVGFAAVLPKLREFFKIADQAEAIFRQGEVDGVVLVDFPGFNWHIAKRAKKYGLPVYYYLPPQLWAWGSWRIAKVRKYVDKVLCNLPFEKSWFESRGVAADYVGHPFFDAVQNVSLDPRFLNRPKSLSEVRVAVLPGSRNHEVHSIWPIQLDMIRRLSAKHPNARFLVAALKDQHALWCRSQMTPADRKLPIEVFVGKTSEIIEVADCALMKSGSVSLEMMARETPCVVIYHVSPTTYALGRMLTNIKSMTLPNMIAGETTMPEFLAVGRSKTAIVNAEAAISELIGSTEARQAQRAKLHALALQFAQPGASQRAAQLILEHLQHDPVLHVEDRSSNHQGLDTVDAMEECGTDPNRNAA